MHLLAYNLIRGLMWQAAATHGRPLHRLSFAGTIGHLNALEPFLAAADLLLPTVDEAHAITGEKRDDRAVKALGTKANAVVVLKKGSSGCSIYQAGGRLDVPGFAVDEIDPTGAGDCFSAGFIAGLDAGWTLEKIGRYANASGALAVTKMGPMEGAATSDQVDGLIGKQTAYHG